MKRKNIKKDKKINTDNTHKTTKGENCIDQKNNYPIDIQGLFERLGIE